MMYIDRILAEPELEVILLAADSHLADRRRLKLSDFSNESFNLINGRHKLSMMLADLRPIGEGTCTNRIYKRMTPTERAKEMVGSTVKVIEEITKEFPPNDAKLFWSLVAQAAREKTAE